MARGAGFFWATTTRSRLSNQKICGTGCRHGNAMSISSIGTVSGSGPISCGGVPNTVARSAAESASPVAGPGAGGS